MRSMIRTRWWSLALLLAAGCKFTGDHGGGANVDDAAVVDAAPDSGPDGSSRIWWNDQWTRRNLVTIHVDQLDATLAGYPLVGFPTLVTLTPAAIDYGAINADGSDLRFVLTDGTTVVPHELDTFVDDGTTRIWVRIPAIGPGTTPQVWLYHGNPAAASNQDAPGVFAATHVSVHHLDDVTEELADATNHGHTGRTPEGNPGAITGAIGPGRDFDGSTEYITLDNEAAYDFTTTLSVSAWIKVPNFTAVYQALVCKGDNTWRIHREDQTRFIGFGTTSEGNDNHSGDVVVDNDQWRHVAIVYDGAAKRIYVDGVQDQSDPYAETIETDDTPVSIGRNANSTVGGTRLWRGGVDEVRISQAARSAAWISAEHRMVTNALVVTIAPDESR
jgi:biopolymer transport protein ExbB